MHQVALNVYQCGHMPYTNIFYTLNDSVDLMTVVTPRQHYGKAYESVGHNTLNPP